MTCDFMCFIRQVRETGIPGTGNSMDKGKEGHTSAFSLIAQTTQGSLAFYIIHGLFFIQGYLPTTVHSAD